nr:copia protein [Tanacetum cinerariifolium]
MTGNRALLTNFVEKFLGTVRFGNNDFAMIAGYGDMVIGSMTIKKVYYVKGKSSNPSVSQVLETSKKDLEDLFHNFYDEYFDASKIMKSLTTNVETSSVEIPSHEEEVFHESSKTFQEEYSSSSLNDTKDHPLHKIIGDSKSSVRTRGQLANSCLFSCLLSSIKPANVVEALRDADWVNAMQDELDQFARLKNCVSISTAKFEYVAVSGYCAQVLWMRTQLTDYGFFYDKVPIYCDSKSAVAISCNPVQHIRTKHIDVRFGMENYDTVPTPMVEQAKMIGSLMNATSSDKLVCWSSKKQNSVSISKTESEYVVVSGCCAQAL